MAGSGDQVYASIIEAAIDSISDIGYYRSTSNEIARRANVTWGAIQFHFGSREALLLSILEQAYDDFIESLASAEVTGKTSVEKMHGLSELVISYYGTPRYIAVMQIRLNLSKDPKRTPGVDRLEQLYAKRLRTVEIELIERTFPEVIDEHFATFIIDSFRRFGIGAALAREFSPGLVTDSGEDLDDLEYQRDLLVQAVNAVYQSEVKAKKSVAPAPTTDP